MTARRSVPDAASSFSALAFATLAGIAGAASAQQVMVYGLIDAAGVRSRDAGGFWQSRLDGAGMSRSFLGVRGSEDLGGGLHLVYRLEAYVQPDTGQIGRDAGDPFWGRDASIGFSGQFGTTVLGRVTTPLYSTTVRFNPFGESPLFSPSLRQYFGGRGAMVGDRSWNNALLYQNNTRDAPLRVALAANLPEKSDEDEDAGRNFGGSLSYITGPFAVAAALERIKNSATDVPAGFHRQLAGQVAASYDFERLRLYGQAGRLKTDGDARTRTTLWQLGAALPIGRSVLMLGYGHSKTTSDVADRVTIRTASVAWDYFLSKNTDLYVGATHEKVTGLDPYGLTVGGGVRHRF